GMAQQGQGAGTVDMQGLAALAQAHAQKYGATNTKAVLAQFGLAKMSDVKPEQVQALTLQLQA
ncbi:MAG: hypothetical protein KAR40_15415, partial [Candidatus Sabulitectum sp.]|nr:hypothetical protein [Candidatus Sabulitectum sp.]